MACCCPNKIEGVNVDAHELFTPCGLLRRDCDAQQSSYTGNGTDNRELLGERADGLQVDLGGQLSFWPIYLTKAESGECSRRYLRKSRISCTRDLDNT